MHCTEWARISPWARSPCPAHGNNFTFHWDLRFCFCGDSYRFLLTLLQWQNTSCKLIGSILPDSTQNSQVSNYFLKRLCATANFAPPPHNSISWKGKCSHGIFRWVYKRKKSLNTYFIAKVQSKQQGNKNSNNKGLVIWNSHHSQLRTIGTMVDPLVWGVFSKDMLYKQLFLAMLFFFQ